VKRYDIVLIQDIRDIAETAIDILVDDVNSDIGFVFSLMTTLMLSTHSIRLSLSSSSSIIECHGLVCIAATEPTYSKLNYNY